MNLHKTFNFTPQSNVRNKLMSPILNTAFSEA